MNHNFNLIKETIRAFEQSKIVIFPTDTAYGIGCKITDKEAIKKLFVLRKRPENQATPVLVSSIDMAKRYLQPLTNNVNNLMFKFWPGALTIVYPCLENKIYSLVKGGGKNLGVRMPDSKVLLSIIEKLNCPILGPSANFHGENTPHSFQEIDKKLLNLVDYALPLDGEIKGGVSTVIDCSVDPFKLIRSGKVII